MQIEGISEIDLEWKESPALAVWNGRELYPLPPENRISPIAFQRAHFNNAEMGYILCKNVKEAPSSQESEEVDLETEKKQEFPSEVKQSVFLTGKGETDFKGTTTSKVSAGHKASLTQKNGNTLDITTSVSHEHSSSSSYGDSRDSLSGEITASYHF